MMQIEHKIFIPNKIKTGYKIINIKNTQISITQDITAILNKMGQVLNMIYLVLKFSFFI